MSEEVMLNSGETGMREQNIILKILRLLAQERLISFEEEMRGEEIVRGGLPGC